ncbi:PREDICTED: histidine triad nucleotide-binding protein 3-like isoform X1 [Poecilia mexicana]|uniref:Histidine triad nucleotide-binding protein 3-like n=3 Tax=Poecilia TaxID=8080 RepID=A0A087XIF5_POEFO|nr:PREDICTED: histidine triad nucleotide-binding protein 3-like isoform X1 [Poecilia formosa]XP_014859958.1 PREDICTED: histidine triad nucleotide-binding protein 3-like isoform X1 [Poecilia mexicana]
MEGKTCKEFDESCIFCHFAHNRDVETTILKQDEEFVCFRDIDPVAPHHYLVIPRDHIVSCKSLNRSHIDLVERMAKFGKEVLLDQGITDMENVRLGFHQPPFISVGHLHLHVLAPASQISTYMQHKFTPGTDRFITEQSLRERLKKVSPLTFTSFRQYLGF